MSKIISVINQKGGVGKSTTAQALGNGLSFRGKKVLFIDLDAQCNLSYSMRVSGSKPSALDVFLGKSTANDTIKKTESGNIMPSDTALAGADALITQTGKEYKLKEALTPIKKSYDYIIIDTPPALGILTVNALTAADTVIIPAQADIFSLQGIGQLYGTIETVKKYCNKSLTISGILITRYNGRAVLSRDILDMITDTAKQINTIVFNTRIRESVVIKEAQAKKESIFTYAQKSKVAGDYNSFIEEFIKNELHSL